jgi:CheY-like chemotaxis protein
LAADARDERAGKSPATLFVCDPSAEAEHAARMLRSKGYTVVDVPLSMLAARAAVQRPSVVLVDADSQGALDAVARVRELPDGESIHVLFAVSPGAMTGGGQDALTQEGAGLFLRPIDLEALLLQVDSLTRIVGSELANESAPGPRPKSTPPPAPVSTAALALSSRPPPSAPPSSADVAHGLPPTSVAWTVAHRAVGLGPPVSTELQRLLTEADERVRAVADESVAPSPEQEIDAVLPAEVLAALDEPIDDDDRDVEAVAPTRPPGVVRDRTSDGSLPRTTGSGSTGGEGATPHASGSRDGGTGDELLTPSPLAADVANPPLVDAVRVEPLQKLGASSGASPRVGISTRIAGIGLDVPMATRAIAAAIAERSSSSLCFSSSDGERRVVLREGDFVTCVSSSDEESLLAFLGVRGDLPRETVRRIGSRFPSFGRLAGAALVARGYLRQDQMWSTLRSHSEWVLSRVMQIVEAPAIEAQPPRKLAAEPSVFGGATGAEVFVDVVRRITTPPDAVEALGGLSSHVGRGESPHLLSECALAPAELDQAHAATGRTLRDVLGGTPESDFAPIVLALALLDVFEIRPSEAGADASLSGTDLAALDSEAIRQNIAARMQLVEEGDYFAVLGVRRDATGYEIRRAFIDLRRAFEPTRILTPELVELAEDVRTIVGVLEEAYEILKDPSRRERYRRAIEGPPLDGHARPR